VARTVIRQIAYDTARTAARRPETSRVHLVSLESLEEMPADTIEIIEGDEEGIERHNGWGPVEITRDAEGHVTGVVFRQCVSVYDSSRRFAPVYDDSITKSIPCDTVLLSVGQSPLLSFLEDGGGDVEMMRPGWPRVDPLSLETSAQGVFVAGDLAHGTRLLIEAVASGKSAARSVYTHITGLSLRADAVTAHTALERYRRERGYESIRRVAVPVLSPEERLLNPDTVVERGYSEEEAMHEASRCLDCGVTPVFDGNRCVLCGGCVDVCPTQCLKLISLDQILASDDIRAAIENSLGSDLDLAEHSAILKDEDRCLRCALCSMRCPADAITMERVTFSHIWRNQ
jgi:ferredoxin